MQLVHSNSNRSFVTFNLLDFAFKAFYWHNLYFSPFMEIVHNINKLHQRYAL